MSGRTCEREEAVVRAVLEGGLTGSLERHAAGCEGCREAVGVTAWMKDVAAAAREAAAEGLPDASGIWWRAEVLARVERRRALVHRAVAPIAAFERWGGLAAALVVAAGVWVEADRIVAWVSGSGAADAVTDPSTVVTIGLGAAVALTASAGWFVERIREA